MRRSLVRQRVDRRGFLEWAYGHLAEADADLGPIAEYLIGRALGCLPPARRVNAPYDLMLPDGRGIEVKATGKRSAGSYGGPLYRWRVDTQFAAGKPLADLWFFLIADFPSAAAAKRNFDVFDPRYWTVHVATGAQLATAGVTTYVSEKTLVRLGFPPRPLATALEAGLLPKEG